MAHGPGKYDHEATIARELTDASAIVLIVFQGNRGDGFAIQMLTPDADRRARIRGLAGVLRSMAEQLEQDAGADV